MEFFRAGNVLPGGQVPVAQGSSTDPKNFTIGDKGSDGAVIIGFKNSLCNEAVHNCLDAAVALANLRASDHVQPAQIVALVTNLFPSAKVAHLDEYLDALSKYQAAQADGKITAAEGLAIALALLPAVTSAIPKNKVTDKIKSILGVFGL